MIELYYMPGNAPSRAVLMCFKQLNLAVELWPVDKLYGDMLKLESFEKGNPGKIFPTINDNGFFLWESRAIMGYLVQKYGELDSQSSGLYPVNPAEKRALIDRLLYFDLGTLFNSLVDYFQPQLVEKTPADPKKEEKLIKALDQLDSLLAGKEFVDGGVELTIADLSIFASVTELRGVDYSVDKWSNICKWASKLEKLLPYHQEVNEEPLKVFREFVKTLKA